MRQYWHRISSLFADDPLLFLYCVCLERPTASSCHGNPSALPGLQGIADLKHSKSSVQLLVSLDQRLSCRIMNISPLFFLSREFRRPLDLPRPSLGVP